MAVELRESATFDQASHREENGKFIVAGRFSKADVRNENGRVYKYSMWENVLQRPYIVDALKKRKMLGELGHPDKIETTPLNVSHIVTKLELKPDGEVYGEAEILDTPSGRVLRTLYEADVTMGISSRGFLPEGSNLYAEGNDMVVPDDYELITFDFVIDPSSQDACPTVQESVKTKLNTILTESRDKLNSDMINYIEGLHVTKLNESEERTVNENNVVKESGIVFNKNELDLINNKRIGKGVKTSMNQEKYIESLEGVVSDLRDRYLTAESVIKDFVSERQTADSVLKGVTNRYLTAEQAIEGLRDYSFKLEETVDEVVKLYNKSTEVIGELRNRYNLAESVIQDLVARYTLSESIIKELSDSYKLAEGVITNLVERYTLSESVISEFASKYQLAEGIIENLVNRNTLSESVIIGLRDRLIAARKSNVSLKRKLETIPAENINVTEEIQKLQDKCQLQEEVIEKLTAQLKEQETKQVTESKEIKKIEESKKAQPVPNSYFEGIAKTYGISVIECKSIFQSLGCRKSAFEYHLAELKRTKQNRYSEFPYMIDGATASKRLIESAKESHTDRIARLVESAF